jgi:hypothetical protein
LRHLVATLGLTAAIGGLFTTSTAHAVDNKAYPGSLCATNLAPGVAANYDQKGRILNQSSTIAMDVTCPIVRDNPTDPWSRVEVVVIDQHTIASCQGIRNIGRHHCDSPASWRPFFPEATIP